METGVGGQDAGRRKGKADGHCEGSLGQFEAEIAGLFEISYFQSRIIVKMTGRRASEIVGGKDFRGSGLGFAHISELGTIATSEPKRAAEIVNGTFPAAKDGLYIRGDDGTRREAGGILRKRDECVERAGGGARGERFPCGIFAVVE